MKETYRNLLNFLPLIFYVNFFYADSFNYNSYNNHGTVGLINMPTARFFNESVHGYTIYDGTPDQKITISAHPFNWLEASFFYTSIQDRPYCFNRKYPDDPVCKQDYKDKGFNLKLRLKKQGQLPAIAIGLNDFAGSGLYSAEYIVGSYGINNTDFHIGLGWGMINGSKNNFENPLGILNDQFYSRSLTTAGLGGSFDLARYFSDKSVSPFFGISHAVNNKILLKLENDITLSPGRIRYEKPKTEFSFGIDYSLTSNFVIGLSHERGNYSSVRFVYKNDPIKTYVRAEYRNPEITEEDNQYTKLIKNLEENGIGVKKITETSRSIGLELTQFIHPDIGVIEEIIATSSKNAGINKNIKKDIEIANLQAISEIDEAFQANAELIYERKTINRINTNTGLTFRPFIASREEFFKGAILVENNTEVILSEDLFFNINLKHSLANNFDDLYLKPVDTFPAQVRSDIKEYLKNMDQDLLIGRAQLDYHVTPLENHHIMITGGILEDMFSGVGMEYLYFRPNTNYSFGFDIFHARKRDYEWKFGHLEYSNVAASVNFYYRNYGTIPFDMRVSAGEYLAGDKGYTIEFSRSFINGVEFGAFATFTDVTVEQFGEGSFDKGVFFNIPIYGNLINYTWRPLTKDPGAKLNRRNTLHDLLVRFRPIN